MLKIIRPFKKLSFVIVLFCSVFIFNDLSAASINFSQLYKASANTSTGSLGLYSVEDNSLISINKIVGTNFKFTSANPADLTFSGNNILGTLTYNNSTGTLISLIGIISRPDKSGSTPLAVNFIVTSDRTVTGEGYALIIASHESSYTNGMNFTTSSDPIATVLNNILTSPSIINTGNLTAMTACSGANSAAQSFTVSATYLTANLVVTAPTGYEVSKTSASGFGSSVSFTPISGTVSSSTVYIRLKTTAINGASGDVTCTSTKAATKYIPTGVAVISSSPTITISPITAVNSTATSFAIAYTGTTGSPNQYSLSASIPALTGFSNVPITSLPSSPIIVSIPASSAGSYGFNLTIVNSVNACNNVYPITFTISDIDPGTVGSDQTICSNTAPNTLTSTTNATGGTGTFTFEWYISTTSISDGFTAIASSNTLNYSPGTLTQTSYFYRKETDQSGTPKTGNSNVITITVNPIATIDATIDGSRCGTGTVDLGATASDGIINWYAASTGGTSLGTGTTFTTPSISSTTTYYVDATSGSCTTASRTAVVATVNAIPTVSGTTPAARCGTGTVDLGATASAGTLNWYAASTGGTSIGTGTTFTTPSISSTTTYYVDATSGSCTTASRTAVVATVNAIPTVSGTTPAARCGTGTVDLGATASAGTLNWYAASTGGTSLGTGTTFTTPSISSTTTYYVDATSGSCTTASRTAVVSTVNAIPTVSGTTPAARCGTGTVDLGATASAGAGTLNWFAASTGGTSLGTGTTFTTPSISSTTTYYVDATSGSCTTASRTAVVATVNAIPTVSGTTPAARCGTGTVDLGATASAGTLNWYAASTGGTSLGTGTTFTTPSITSTTTYYVDATSGSCTTASRTAVVATISICIVANPDINATMVNTPVTGSVNTNDKTTSGTTYTTGSASSANPSGATLTMNTDGSYTFTALLPGKYIYYVNVCAAGQTTDCAIATLEISVTDPNSTTNPPLAKNDYSTTQVNTPAVVKVLSNDKVANPGTSLLPSTITIATAPTNGTVAVNTTTGVITFTPATGFTGTDSLNYNVCDNSSPSNCQVATVYFKISSNAVAEYTTADDDFNTVNMNTSVTGNVLSNDINSLGNALTVTSNTAPLSTQGTITINSDGSYTFTPTANFFGPVDITYTACSSTSACAIATLHILVVPVKPAPPKPIHGTYTTGASTNPTTIAPTVTQIPAGCKVIYCNVSGLSCATTAPALPTVPGIYVWCVKSLDTITGLTSAPCVYDTLRILPKVTTKNATYLTGVVANPTNISGLVTSITAGSTPKWCDVSGTTCTSTAPSVPTITGTYIWCVKAVDVASGLVSASCVMDTVTILAPYTVLEVTKTARSVKSNPDGSFLVTFAMKATNKTDAILDSVTIKDNLAKTFNSFSGITVYSLETFGGLVKNSAYDGISNIELVTSQSKINAKSSDSLILKVLVASTNISGDFLNTSILGGKTKYGVISVESNDPGVNASDTTKRFPTPFVVPKIDVIIAGGFSPNQDGINDKWIIVRPFGTTIEVRVFNRWGNIVYQNSDYKNDWTGRGVSNFSGDYVPEGTYFYTVNAIDNSGNIKKFTSSLTIVR